MTGDRKAAIVTGSATGVGAATAKLLAAKGYNLVINYSRSETEAKETAAACGAEGAEVLVVKGNVAVDADCRAIADAAIRKWGRVDILVNNAGTTKFVAHGDLEGLSAEDFQHLYAVNVVGPFQMTRAVEPQMKKQGDGAIVMISSIAGITGIGSSVAYTASKGALNTMTKSLARALAPEIRVNALCPGMIDTRWFREGIGLENYGKLKGKLEEGLPLKKIATAEDVAEAAVWLAEDARLMTGETVLLDGGQHLKIG